MQAGTQQLCDIRLDIEPPTVTHHDKVLGRNFKTGKANLRDSSNLVNARETYHRALLAAHRKPPQPWEGPLYMEVTFCFRSPQIGWMTKKPDRDNLCKTLQDALTVAGFIQRDELVVTGPLDKITGPKPFIRIILERADENQPGELYQAVRGCEAREMR